MNYQSGIIFIIFLSIYGCSSKPETEGSIEKPVTPVTITGIRMEPIAETIELNAVSNFIRKNTVRSNTTGLLESTNINMGDHVEKGQTLFTLKTKEAAALANNATDSNTHINFNGLIKIIASKNGVISSISHFKGDFIQEGDELCILSDPSSLVFLLQVPFEFSNLLKINEVCELTMPDSSRFKGTIKTKLPAMDITVQTETYIVTPATGKQFPENLIVKVRIVKNSKKLAIILPKPAILTNETQTGFWIMKLINDSVAVKIPIKKGIETIDKIEVLEPRLEKSDRILMTGNYGLDDTAKVSINKE